MLIEAEPEHFNRHSHWLSAATAMNIQEYLRLQASILMTAVDQNTPRVTPGIFFSLRPYPAIDLNINAFYKQSYRYPTFNDLYYTDLGNADLRPELARQHSIEVAYRGTVKINGVDAHADFSFFLPQNFTLRARLNYTYQTAIDVTNPEDTYYGHQIPYIPWHSGSVVGGLDWKSKRGDHYGFNYSFIYVGKRYCQQENTVYNEVLPWYTHDLMVYAEWCIHTNHDYWLKANIELNNMLGQDYEVIRNYPMPKQNIRCTLAFRY